MLLAAAVLALVPQATSDTPDLIVLESGKEIECRVLFEDDETIVYTRKRKAEEIARSEVTSVQSIERSLREFLARYDEIPPGNVDALLELASFCESRELFGEARHLRIRVLTIDPENEAAWTELGGSYTERRGWRMKVRGRYYSIEQLRERVADWKNAMEIPTAHFLIKTDVSPETALDLAIDIERAYLTFYDLLGQALRLYPFDEVPEVRIHASPDDFPVAPDVDDIAWFQPRANVMYIDATAAEPAPHGAVASVSDLLLWNALRRTVGRTGNTPAWFRDALGQAFGAAYRPRVGGHATWDLSQPIVDYFQLHAQAEKPLSLKDVVNVGFKASDSGTRAQLVLAQSYTLGHFLAYGEDGALRTALGVYLGDAFTGKKAVTHLEKATGMKAKELEERWRAHVALVSGIEPAPSR